MSLDSFFLEVPGTPIPKGRPRMTRTGRPYTPARTRNYESDVRVLGRQKMKGRVPYSGPVEVEITAYLPMPTSWPKWKKALVTNQGIFIRHTSKPDSDNLGKIIDGLNGVVWKDDAQITDLHIRKRYSELPRLTISVTHDHQAIHSKTKTKPSGRIT